MANCSNVPRAWVVEEEVIHISKSPDVEPTRNFGGKGSCEDREEKRAETGVHYSYY